ncbi:MAG TPA: hypothetical protein VFR58_00110 [Flavisolibacter sp.]|nr:hypothetical protein [Flavisolibacter sp.]
MSSRSNDNKMIHLGNYEEYFILYMDNELSEAERAMVDSFLAAHPDLMGEFELLAGTKLPVEEFTISKNELFSDHIRLQTIDEDLLLYIDNELAPLEKKAVEKNLSTDAEYRLQHQLLLAAKLDPAEKIVYPNKEELYHRAERKVFFKPWMRVAAAAVLIAGMSIAYFSRQQQPANDGQVAVQAGPRTAKPSVNAPVIALPANDDRSNTTAAIPDKDPAGAVLPVPANIASPRPANRTRTTDINSLPDNSNPQQDVMAVADIPMNKPSQPVQKRIEADVMASVTASYRPSEIINEPAVTSSLGARITDNHPTDDGSTAKAEDAKGSIKGFLRRATRLIEKKTGIDPINDDGQLLIGAVAVKLK